MTRSNCWKSKHHKQIGNIHSKLQQERRIMRCFTSTRGTKLVLSSSAYSGLCPGGSSLSRDAQMPLTPDTLFHSSQPRDCPWTASGVSSLNVSLGWSLHQFACESHTLPHPSQDPKVPHAPWYEPRLRDSTLKNTTLLVKEEAALECCLGKNVCIYVQVKACTEMTFASGLMLMDGRWIEKNIHSYFVKFRAKPIGSSEKILNPVTSLKLKELCWENTP